ncbi:ABC transporter, partial [Mycobacterium tuberculosis]
TLAFPIALRSLIDNGLISSDKGAQTMALREHFGALFAVAVALGVFSAARFYTVSWLGERVTADIRNAVYG